MWKDWAKEGAWKVSRAWRHSCFPVFVLSLRAGNLFFFLGIRQEWGFFSLSVLILCFVLEESNCQEH